MRPTCSGNSRRAAGRREALRQPESCSKIYPAAARSVNGKGDSLRARALESRLRAPGGRVDSPPFPVPTPRGPARGPASRAPDERISKFPAARQRARPRLRAGEPGARGTLEAKLEELSASGDRDPARDRRARTSAPATCAGAVMPHGHGHVLATLPQGRRRREVAARDRRRARGVADWSRDALGGPRGGVPQGRRAARRPRGARRSTRRRCSARARPRTRPRSTRPAS